MKMQKQIPPVLIFFVLLFLVSCVSPKIVAIPEKHGDILTGSVASNRIITISNDDGTLVCNGEYKITKNTLTCEGKEGAITFTCSDRRVINAV